MSDPTFMNTDAPPDADVIVTPIVLTCQHCGEAYEDRVLIFTDDVADVHSIWTCPNCHADNDVSMTLDDYQDRS